MARAPSLRAARQGTAGGKALLAERERWRGSLLRRTLTAYTERTVIDPSAMEQEAATTRQRGYAIDEGEYRRGVHALVAAVHDRAGEAIAAIGVSSAGRLNVETVSDDVVAVAARLTEALTHGDAESAR